MSYDTMFILYHRNCNDGMCAAAIVANFYSKIPPENIIDVDYIDADWPQIIAGKANSVIIVDFCYPKAWIEEIAKCVSTVRIIDHHKSSLWLIEEEIPENVITVFDPGYSGASLAWGVYHPETEDEMPDLVKYVEDRDLWRKQLDYTDEVFYYLSSLPTEIEFWQKLVHTFDINEAIHAGRQIKQWVDVQINALYVDWCDNPTFMQIQGYKVPAINAPKVLASDLGHILSEGSAFAVVYYHMGGKAVFSLRRSNESRVDLSEVAQLEGGGGHPGASGFTRDFLPQFDSNA